MLRENSLRSASSSIVGRCFGSELIAKPNSTSWMIGMPTIMPNVSRSRFSWMNSLPTMPSQRENEKNPLMAPCAPGVGRDGAAPSRLCIRWMNTSSRPGSIRRHVRPGSALNGASAASSAAASVPVMCSAAPNAATWSTAGNARSRVASAGQRRALDRPGDERLARDDLARRALRQQPSAENVAELVAALGLVHVVRADEHGDAARGELVQLVPEIAPRLRIDAGGRLVQQQQLRLVQQARGERQALLPAAGKLARELVRAIGEAESRERVLDALVATSSIEYMRADEAQVLADRQVLPQREALRHVARRGA